MMKTLQNSLVVLMGLLLPRLQTRTHYFKHRIYWHSINQIIENQANLLKREC